MPDIHAKLSPSSAHRWLHCNAALAAEQFEPNKTTSYAEEGTTAHHLAETILRNRLKPRSKASPVPQVSQEMVDKVGDIIV